jgi:galactosamine-6-phosphate isomerase
MSRWLYESGPLDLCILGLGRNGHVLMNEPAAEVTPFAHVARLAPSTRRHPTLRALKTPPRRGLTLGLGEILQSKAILLLVSGRHKSAALKRTLSGRVTTRCPASFLWLHPDVTVICDRAAAGGGRKQARS